MKNLITTLLIVLVMLAIAPIAQAQTPMPWTQLGAAVLDQNTRTISVTSLTSSGNSTLVLAAPTLSPGSQMMLAVDQEEMNVIGVSGTTITVTRGYDGTTATAHANSHIVWFGPYNYFYAGIPAQGACNPAAAILPRVVRNQDSKRMELWDCGTGDDIWVQQQMTESVGKTYTRFCTTPLASFSLLSSGIGSSSLGNNQTPVAGSVYYGTIEVPRTMLATGLSILNGSVAGTDKWNLTIFRADGTQYATTPVAGTAVGGNGTYQFQDIAFAANQVLTGPARYWISVQGNGTTARFINVPIPSGAGSGAFTGLLGSSFTGAFGNIPSLLFSGLTQAISLPTSLIANTAPVACVY